MNVADVGKNKQKKTLYFIWLYKEINIYENVVLSSRENTNEGQLWKLRIKEKFERIFKQTF